MGFMDKIKGAFEVPEDEYYDDVADDVSFTEDRSRTKEERRPRQTSGYQRDDDMQTHTQSQRNNGVLNIHATTQLQVVLVKPENFEDAKTIANHLNDKRTVVVNLEKTNKDVARRLIDFLSGVTYANRGNIKRIANNTFIITPFNVDIMGDMLIDELENNGYTF
ncbi:MAG: cell division protein SepF [Acutalibacteraceae bacterium]